MVTKEKNNLAKTFPIFSINILHDILHEFIKKIYINDIIYKENL